MFGFKIALQFLTIMPVQLPIMPNRNDVARALKCFPLAGLCIGLVLALAGLILTRVFSGTLINVCLVVPQNP